MKLYSYFLALSTVLFSSCISLEDVVYFQDNEFSTQESLLIPNVPTEYKLQKGDVLSVKIKTLEVENAEFLNLEPGGGFNAVNSEGLFLYGYSIMEDGNVYLPLIGSIEVIDKTLTEAQDSIQLLVDDYFTDATAIVTLVSFKISILGEVANPGYFYIYNNRLTILEALALAGDLKEFADRTEVLLSRQTDKGPEVTLVDLTTPSVFESPLFFIKPNDTIYVKPLKSKTSRSNLSALTVVTTALAVISTGLSIYALGQN